MVVSNIGIVPDFSALYTTNSRDRTPRPFKWRSSRRTRSAASNIWIGCAARSRSDYPDLRTFFSSGSMVDGILNMGMPVADRSAGQQPDLDQANQVARDLADRIREMPGVSEAYIPQDMNYPAVRLDVDRVHAAELGLTRRISCTTSSPRSTPT